MVGPINNMQQGQQAKLSLSLDYDVLIIGAGQVGNLPVIRRRQANGMYRVECILYIGCVN